MTAQEAADWLKISRRQFDRLGVPREYVGKSPRYRFSVVDGCTTKDEPIPSSSSRATRLTRSRYQKDDGNWLASRLASVKKRDR